MMSTDGFTTYCKDLGHDKPAEVTGMSNLEVAQYLLQHGLEGLDGVLFLNERNERVSLASFGIPGCPFALDALGIHQAIHAFLRSRARTLKWMSDS